jgi:hypothetical protein
MAERSPMAARILPILVLGAIFLCWVVALPVPAIASPESSDLIRQGWEALRQGQTEDAIVKLERAVAADPGDPDALFYLGAVLNRDGRPKEALARLEAARQNGVRHPDVDFEIGWSLLGVGRFAEAAEALERYERLRPGRGKASEFLGRALIGVGRLDEAERKLNEALARDAALKPGVLYYLALVTGADDEGGPRLEELLKEKPRLLFGAVWVGTIRASGAGRARGETLAVSLSTAGGYNSNVIGLADGLPLPDGISTKRSGFARFSLNTAWDWTLGAADGLTAEYGFVADVYESVPSSDLRSHAFLLDAHHRFRPNLVASLRLGDEYTEIGGESFRNQATVRPALAYRFTSWWAVETAYSFTASDYYASTTPLYNRDANSHSAALTGYFAVPGTRLELRLGYFHVWNLAEGRDFDFQTRGFTVGASHPLVWRISAAVQYTRTQDDYDHANSLAGFFGFEFRRRDTGHALTVQIGRPLLPWLGAFARWDRVETDSNIRFYRFLQNVGSAGLVASF